MDGHAAAQQSFQVLTDFLMIVRMDELKRRSVENILNLSRPYEDSTRVVDVDGSSFTEDKHPGWRQFNQRPVPLFALPHRLFHSFAIGHIGV